MYEFTHLLWHAMHWTCNALTCQCVSAMSAIPTKLTERHCIPWAVPPIKIFLCAWQSWYLLRTEVPSSSVVEPRRTTRVPSEVQQIHIHLRP